jgi:hypothetical protein
MTARRPNRPAATDAGATIVAAQRQPHRNHERCRRQQVEYWEIEATAIGWTLAEQLDQNVAAAISTAWTLIATACEAERPDRRHYRR